MMKQVFSPYRGIILTGLFLLILSGCVKHEFQEPPDPFEKDRLEDGYTCFEFTNATDTFRLLTNPDNLTTTPKGNMRIRGTIFADRDTLPPVRLSQGDFILVRQLRGTPENLELEGHGPIPIHPVDIKVMNGPAGCSDFKGFGGYAEFTLPQVGLVQDLEIPDVDGSPIGFARGADLEGFPVNPNNFYFYFYYDNLVGFAVSQTGFYIDKMALDPEDPYFYVHADAMDIPGLSVVEGGGFAVSVQGNIPFTVPASLSFGHVEAFSYGNVMVEATINLEDVFGVPLTIDDATCTIGFGSVADGRGFFDGLAVPMMVGVKGSFVVVILEVIEWPLGDAAMSLRINGYNDFRYSFAGYFSNEATIFDALEDLTGIEGTADAFSFIKLPQQTWQIQTYGTLSTNIEEWEVGLKTNSEMEFPGIMTIDMGGVDFEANKDHLYYHCRMPISFFGTVGMEGEIERSGAFWIKGYTKAGESFGKWGLEIDVGYKAHFLLDVDAIDDWYFEVYGKVYLDISIGEPWLKAHGYENWEGPPNPEIAASVSFEASLNSSGKFKGKIKFSFLGVGYSFGFSFSLGGEPSATSIEFLEEIPLDEVPIENRFEVK